jgi:hypothetical protein
VDHFLSASDERRLDFGSRKVRRTGVLSGGD